MDKANLGMMRIDARHCFKCGCVMPKTGKNRRTNHHSIPKFLKPLRNIEIPVCDACHKDINAFTVQSVPKLDAVDNLVTNLKMFISKYEKVVKRHKKPEEELEIEVVKIGKKK